MLKRLRQWARTVKRDAIALWIAARDPRTPWYAKAIAILVAGYALSPVDLIPDFIPVIGYLDDAVVVPLGIVLAVRLIPADLMNEFRSAADRTIDRPSSRVGAAIIILVWIAVIVLVGRTLWRNKVW
ncbi:MAG: YkvA family protein [Acidobacteriaceae bacterium]